jgi:GH25 family lysozyme M1 (1,4-beta-N-acetylmuramidase)
MIFPDISRYQGEPNFDKMKSKTDYVILKAGQGNFTDSQFTRNRNECERVGLSYGVYWFYDDRRSPQLQAQTLYNALLDHPMPAEIWCDWENFAHLGDRPYSQIRDVVAFMERVEQLTGKTVGMYTGYYWFMENSDAITNASQYRYLAARPLWLAWYTPNFTNTGIDKVKIPPPWHEMEIWQYGTPSLGYEYGVQSIEIDMNERFDGVPVPPPTGDPTMWKYEYLNTIGSMSIRPAPNTNNNPIGTLAINVKGYGNELFLYSSGDKWVKVEQGGSAVGWVAVIHQGKPYGNLTELIVEPPPPPAPEPLVPLVVTVAGEGYKTVVVNLDPE